MKDNCDHLLDNKNLKKLFITVKKYLTNNFFFSCKICSTSSDLLICLFCQIIYCKNDRCNHRNSLVLFNGERDLKCLNSECSGLYEDLKKFVILPSSCKKITFKYRGLPNLGNTCYLNSVVQCLFGLTAFTRALLLKTTCNNKNCLQCSTCNLFVGYIKNDLKSLPYFINCVMEGNKEYKNTEQHDAYLFFLYLTNMKCKKNISNLQNLENESSNPIESTNNISSIFEITGYNILRCEVCETKRSLFKESHFSLSLEFTPSLKNSLKKYFQSEKLQDLLFCKYCKEKTVFYKYFKLKNTNEILVLHIKRFKVELKNCKKLTENFKFEPVLKIKSSKYRLACFIVHKGTINSGHYVTYVLKGDHYLCMDDERKCVVNQSEELKKAYVLFYERM